MSDREARSAAQTWVCPKCNAVAWQDYCQMCGTDKFHPPSDEGKAPSAEGQNSQRRSETGDGSTVVGEGWPDGSGVLAGASDEEAPAGNDGRASDPSAATKRARPP